MIKPAILFSFLLFGLNVGVAAQTNATLLVIPNVDAVVLVDGIEKGQTKASTPLRITLAGGEHHVAIQTVDGLTIGQLVQLESGKEETLKITIGNMEVVPAESGYIAEIKFEIPDSVAIAYWQSANEGRPYPYPEYYYAFEKGDEIILNLTLLNKNGTNQLTVSTYPDGLERYSNKAFAELSDLRIKVPQRSIYRFAFAANNGRSRHAFFKISRKPETPETANFNSKVIVKKTFTPIAVVAPQDFSVREVNATDMEGKSRMIIPVTLPPNTVEWFYRFSASKDTAVIENVKKNFGLLREVTEQLSSFGEDTVITTVAMERLTQPPGTNYCDIYFLDRQFARAFEAKEDKQWRYLPEASREKVMAGNVKVKCCNSGQYFLGIKNPNSSFGVIVSIEVVALIERDEFAMDDKRKKK